MTWAENYAEMLGGSRTLREYGIALQQANAACTTITFEQFNDRLGQPLSCAIELGFPDGSRIVRVSGTLGGQDVWEAR